MSGDIHIKTGVLFWSVSRTYLSVQLYGVCIQMTRNVEKKLFILM